MSDIIERECCAKAALVDDYCITVERLRSDVRALSRVLNGIGNRPDLADKVLEAARKGRERGKETRKALEGK